MYVCLCKAVKDAEIQELLETGQCSTLKEISQACCAGRQCGRCVSEIRNIINDFKEKQSQFLDFNLGKQIA